MTILRLYYKHHRFRALFCMVLGFAFGVSLLFSFDHVNATAKQSTLTMTLDTNVLALSITPSATGTFAKSNDAEITVSTDNFTGYTLSIAATSNSTSLVDGNNHEITSISSNVDETSFSTNTNYNNKWGYVPSQYISSSGGVNTVISNTDYLPAPDTSGTILDVTSAANSSSNSYTLSFGARVDGQLPSGTYTYTYVVRAVANTITYNVTFDENTTDTVTNMPDPNPQALILAGGTPVAQSYAPLSEAVPILDGKTFGGWCDEATTPDQTTGNDLCAGHTYQAGDDYPIDQTVGGTNITLYAIWLEDPFPIAFSQMGKCIFNRGTISGSECQKYVNDDFIDTKVALYSSENYAKDYEVHFTIDVYNPSSQVQVESQTTLFNDKLSSSVTGSPYGGKSPGIVVRTTSSNGFEIRSTYGAPNDQPEHRDVIKTPASTGYNGTDVRIFRINQHIYTSLDNGPLIELQDFTPFDQQYHQQFGLTAWFGAYPDNVNCTENCTAAKRYFTGEMSNMYIKLGDMPANRLHTITFDANTGTPATTTHLILDGDALGEFPEVTKSGWLFDGWWTAQSGGEQISTATVPSTTTTYWAHWKLSVADAQITNPSIQLAINDTEAINITNASDIEPYSLTSSDSNVATVDSSGVVTAVGNGTATITMTGTLSGDTRTISVTVGTMITVDFDSQSGTPASYQLQVADGGSFSSLPNPTRIGYALDGWYTGTGGTGTKLTTSTIFDSNTPTQYYAKWVEETYVCKMATTLHKETCERTDSNGCRKYSLYEYDDKITYGKIPDNVNRSAGFAYTCDINADGIFNETDERFYYLGENNNNAVMYYYKNFINVTENYAPALADLPDSSTWTNPSLVPQAENKVARFMKYNEEALPACGNSATGLYNHTCEYLLEESNYAHMDTRQDGIWMMKVNDTITGGRRIHTASLGFGTNMNPNIGGSNNAPRPVIEVPLSLVEEYVPVVKHSITFDPQNDGQSSASTIEVIDGNAIGSSLPGNPSYTNHLFQRWYDTTNDNTVDASTVPTGDMTVYAEWKGTVALAQVASNNISVVEGNTTTFQVTNASDIETFTCSSSNSSVATVDSTTCVVSGVSEGTATISITGNDSHTTNSNIVTVSVLDPSSVYRVTFDPRNGESTSFTDVNAGNAIGAGMPQNPTNTGYVFVRWYDVANGNTVTAATEPIANMTVYAEWKLDVTNAVISNDLILAVGDQLTILVDNASQLEPYTFSSADTSKVTVNATTGEITGVGAGTTYIIMTGSSSGLTKNLEVSIAPAPVTQYTVTFNANGGTTPSPSSSYKVNDGDQVGTLPTTSRTNYRFFGWYKDDGTFYEEVYPEEIITGDVTYYARWIEDTSSFPIVFSETNACTFGGHNVNVSGTYCSQPKNISYIDSMISLYSTTNYGKDYEIGFTIVDYDYSNVQQMTMLAAKYENTAAKWPGLAVRRSNSTSNMEVTHSMGGTKASNTSTATSVVHHFKVVRESGVIRFSINNGQLMQLQNLNSLTEQDFNHTVWFGASAKENNTPQREFIGTLTDMYVKLGVESEYVINFNPNDGSLASGEESRTINVGDQVGQLPVPTPPSSNYTFVGWFDESVSPAVAISATTEPDGNKTYVAHYTYQSSDTPVVFDVSNNATRGYQALLNTWTGSPVGITTFNESSPINNSTWGDTSELSELDYWTAIRSNFVNNECLIKTNSSGNTNSDATKPLSTLPAWVSGSVDCSKPDAYDTKINAPLTVRLNNSQGAEVAYAKASSGVIHNMIPGQTYYWEKTSDSTVYGYVTVTSNGSNTGTRWVDTGIIRNARDLGGLPVTYTDSNNQTVTGTLAYGRIFRGEKLQSAPASELTNLGITTEYNLGDEYSGDTHLSDYHLNQVVHYNFDYNSGDENNNNSNYMKAWNAVTNIMTDITNANTTKNVYLHCRVGADRTGTVAYLLEGLLGVPDEQRYQEYGLTNLSGLYDRTRYYKEKVGGSTSPTLKFVYMMSYVLTNQDIYDWYMSNPNADVNLIQAFRTAMTVISNQQQNSPQNSPQNSSQNSLQNSPHAILNSVSMSLNSGNNSTQSSPSESDEANNAEDSYSEPLGVSESSFGLGDSPDSNSSSVAGLLTAAAVVGVSGATISVVAAKYIDDGDQLSS